MIQVKLNFGFVLLYPETLPSASVTKRTWLPSAQGFQGSEFSQPTLVKLFCGEEEMGVYRRNPWVVEGLEFGAMETNSSSLHGKNSRVCSLNGQPKRHALLLRDSGGAVTDLSLLTVPFLLVLLPDSFFSQLLLCCSSVYISLEASLPFNS